MLKPCVIVALLLAVALGGCQTNRDTANNVAYVKATEADKAGRYNEAFAHYNLAAQSPDYDGRWAALYRIADMHLTGQGTRKDPAKAIALLKEVSTGKDKTLRGLAQAFLGDIFEEGVAGTVAVDRATAAIYFKAAALNGLASAAQSYKRLSAYPEVYVATHPDAFRRPTGAAPGGVVLAFKHYESGEHAAAFRIFDWHARNGNEQAQYALATMFRRGLSVAADPEKYVGWMWMAASSGNARAQFGLGMMYFEGDPVPGSDAESARWLVRASDQGLAEATAALGIVAGFPADKDRKPDWPAANFLFKKAAEQGSTEALIYMGDSAFEGRGRPVDKEMARDLYELAADDGSVKARARLFERYDVVYAAPQPQGAKSETASTPAAGRQTAALPSARTQPAVAKPTPVEVYERLSPSVFRLFAANDPKDDQGISQGSAIAITENTAITNCHVIEGMKAIAAVFNGTIVGFVRLTGDEKKDICLVGTTHKLRPITALRRYAELRVGEKVYALGSPISMENTFSDGIVSGLRTMEGTKYVQTSAPISNGSSGGGLFDEDGRLIGVTTLGLQGGENLNFAVAIDEAIAVINAKR